MRHSRGMVRIGAHAFLSTRQRIHFYSSGGGGGGTSPIVQTEPAIAITNGGSIAFTPTATQGTGITWSASDLPTGASINSSTGEITGTLSINGHWHTKITATNGEGDYSVYVPIIVSGSVVDIDASWIAGAGTRPYKLSTANARYRLTQNVTVDDSAFVFQANGVTLDLNGYTITYNNAAATALTNEDFDNWTGTEPNNWTVTGSSSHDKIAAASSYIYPRKMCEGDYAVRVNLAQRTAVSCTLSAGSPATISATAHGLSTGDGVYLSGFSATSYGVGSTTMIFGGYKVTVIDANTFSINANVSAVSDGSGTFTRATLIESDARSLPTNNRMYNVTAFVSNDSPAEKLYHCSIKAVDSSTGLEMGKLDGGQDLWGSYNPTYASNGSRNHSPSFSFKSGTTANVKVQIYLATTDASVTVDVCRARMSQAYDNGVAARGNNGTEWPQRFSYDTTGWSTSADLGPLAIIDTAGGGSITQGQNKGFRGWPILLRKCSGATTHGISWVHTGDDPCIMFDHATLGTPTTARGLLVSSNAADIANVVNACRRDSQMPSVVYRTWLGMVNIWDNTLDGSPTISVNGSTSVPATYATSIHRNTIRPKTVVTNSYAIAIATRNVSITENTVNSTLTGGSGRCCLLNAGQNITLADITLTDNVFRAREERHREWSNTAYTRALRLRNTENGESTNGTILNIVSSGNLYHCECPSTDYAVVPQGARISIRDNSGGMDATTITFTNDTFSAINATTSGSAMGIEIGRKDALVADIVMTDPTFISNHRVFKLHGTDDVARTIDGIQIDGATFTKDGTTPAPASFYTFDFGYNGSSVSTDINLTNNTFGSGTAYNDITSTGTHTDVSIEP